MAPEISSISPIVRSISFTAATAVRETDWISSIWRPISSVALAVCPARFLTSLATTAKPLPASPARAASIVAFSASRLVCAAISEIRVTTSPIRVMASDRVEMVRCVYSLFSTALLLTVLPWLTCVAISRMDAVSCSTAEATVSALLSACSAAAATSWLLAITRSADSAMLAACWFMALVRPRHLIHGRPGFRFHLGGHGFQRRALLLLGGCPLKLLLSRRWRASTLLAFRTSMDRAMAPSSSCRPI